MADRIAAIRWIVLVLGVTCCIWAQDTNQPTSDKAGSAGETLELARHLTESSSVRIEPARLDNKFGIALIFEGTDDLHYYAKSETAPAPGFELQATANSEYFDFQQAVFSKWHPFTDALGNRIEVFSGNFLVFIPMTPTKTPAPNTADIEVAVSGIACTSLICLSPFKHKLHATIDWTQNESWKEIGLETTSRPGSPIQTLVYPVLFVLLLTFLALLALRIRRSKAPYILLMIFVLLLLCGIFFGEVGKVLRNATLLCLDCIGIG